MARNSCPSTPESEPRWDTQPPSAPAPVPTREHKSACRFHTYERNRLIQRTNRSGSLRFGRVEPDSMKMLVRCPRCSSSREVESENATDRCTHCGYMVTSGPVVAEQVVKIEEPRRRMASMAGGPAQL